MLLNSVQLPILKCIPAYMLPSVSTTHCLFRLRVFITDPSLFICECIQEDIAVDKSMTGCEMSDQYHEDEHLYPSEILSHINHDIAFH